MCSGQVSAANISLAGLALKQLTDNEGRPYHANIRHNKRREKGKWLAETVKETMTSISMNEDLYDSDDETPPPSALRKRNRTSMVHPLPGTASLACRHVSSILHKEPLWCHCSCRRLKLGLQQQALRCLCRMARAMVQSTAQRMAAVMHLRLARSQPWSS
jgi:hypothetical protein